MCLVDTSTGRLGLSETDWDLPLPMPLQDVRSYRSTNQVCGDLGYGWGHTWGARLWSGEPGQVTLWLPDGRRVNLPLPEFGAVAVNEVEETALISMPVDELPWAEVRPRTGKACYLAQIPGTPTLVFSDQSLEPRGFVWLGMADRASNWIEISCDRLGLPVRAETPWQKTLRFVRTPHGLLSEVWLESPSAPAPGLCLVKYEYDREFDLVGVHDPSGARRYRYRDHLLIAHVDRAGGACISQFDAERRCVMTSGPEGVGRRVYQFGPPTRVTNSLGATTIYRSNPRDLVAEVEDAAGHVSAFEYDQAYRVVRATNQLGQVTEFAYGPNGAMLSKIGPTGDPDLIETNERGAVVRHLSPTGVPRLEVTRDELDRVVAFKSAGSGVTKLAWNADGTIAAITHPTGQTITSRWDPEQRARVEEDAEGLVSRRTYDATGKLVAYEDALGQTTYVTYDGRGHLQTITHEDGTQERFELDGEGHLLKAVDETGTTFEYRYDTAHRVTALLVDGVVVSEADYNTESYVVRVRARGAPAWEFERDATGKVLRQRFPDGRVQEYRYDPAGRLHQLIDPRGDVIEGHYDPAGRLASVTFPDGGQKRITRNEDGRWIRVEAGGSVCEREFDDRGRPARETQDAFSLEMKYNDAELLAKVTASDGRRVEYDYDERGNVAAMRVHPGRLGADQIPAPPTRSHRFDYDRLGRLALWTMPGKKREVRTYDARGRLASQAIYAGERRIVARTYRYDAAGRLTHRTDSLRGDAFYDYDAGGRLVAAGDGTRRQTFGVSDAGDLTNGDFEYLPGHRVQRAGQTRFTYDARGFVVARHGPRGIDQFDYNYQGLLTRFRAPAGTTIEYRHDGLTRLRAKLKDGVETIFRWHGRQPWSIQSSDGRRIEFASMPGEFTPREYVVDGKACTLHTDHLGRALELIDDDGRVVWLNTHDVWGRGREDRSPDAVDCLCEYPGQLWDADLRLYYHRYRHYDPLTGHFVVPDPLGLWGGMDLYAYPSDPVNTMDPLGLTCQGMAQTPTLYRGGGGGRPPDQVCAQGFVAHDPTQTVLQHVNGGCGWISTSYNAAATERFARNTAQRYGGQPYVYVIANPGCGVETECDPGVQAWQQQVGMDPANDDEFEVAFNTNLPGGQGGAILGYYDASIGPQSFQAC